MNNRRLAMSAVLALSTTLAGAASADAIIDPDLQGATRVFPPLGSGDLAGSAFGRNITVGFSGFPGTLEVNANRFSNRITRLTNVGNLNIAQRGPNERGEVRVIGNGAAGSAGIELNGDFRLGANSDSLLRIANGGEVIHTPEPLATRGGNTFYSPEGIFIGSFADFLEGTGSAEIVVEGAGSRLVTRGGRFGVGFFNTGEVDRTTIADGGRIDVRLVDRPEQYDLLSTTYDNPKTGERGRFNQAYFDGLVSVGARDFDFSGDTPTPIDGPADELTITGAGSQLNFASTLRTNGNAAITVENGGAIYHVEEFRASDRAAYVDLYYEGLNPFLEAFDESPQVAASINLINGEDVRLKVTGAGSLVDVTRNVDIGGFGADASVTVENGGILMTAQDVNVSSHDNIDGSGRLTVGSGGLVSANAINVLDGGVLDGDGGFLNANVFLNGGVIAPGASPGVMTILGDLEILDGLLQIEIAGTEYGMFDQLDVTGDLIASSGFDINVSFLDGFVPEEGDVFNFLNIGGDASVLSTLSLINFTFSGGGVTGDDFELNLAGGGLTLVSTATDVAPVPLPAGLPMLVAGLFGLGWAGRRRNRIVAAR